MTERRGHPAAIRPAMRAAIRLEWWNIAWTTSVIVAMAVVMGSSQAMRTAWIEDMLGLVPPIAFLVAERYERRPASKRHQYGFDRVNGLGFMIAAVALAAVGVVLLKDSVTSLVTAEHVTIGSMRIFGRDIWMGWFMLAAQTYAIIPPLIIGHKELPLAEKLRDKLLHTDALMNKANWQTGVAGIVGVAGLGAGWWWADASAAALISLSIIFDGWKAMEIATAELVDGVPNALGERDKLSDDAKAVRAALRKEFADSKVIMRETGRFIRAEVVGATPPEGFDPSELDIPGLECPWRLDAVTFRP